MRFSIAAAAVVAFASSVLAQTPGFDVVSKPAQGEVVPAGSTYEISWAPNANWTGTVTIGLLGGESQIGLHDLSFIAKGIDTAAGKYPWAVDKTLGKLKMYGLRIALDSDTTVFQYSFPFAIKASDDSSSPSATSGTASSTTTSTSTTTETSTETSATDSAMTTPTPSGNLPTTNTPSKSVVTLTTTTSSKPSSQPTNGAGTVGGSSIALFGGLAMAMFAL